MDNPVHIHDLHATILKLLGLDHTKLTFLFQGRQQRLTDEGGDEEFAGTVDELSNIFSSAGRSPLTSAGQKGARFYNKSN